MNKPRYTQRIDGEAFTVPAEQITLLACCDCGLVHRVVYATGDGVVGIAAERDNRRTAQRRRWMRKRGQPPVTDGRPATDP